jgi:hypothetical protein
MVKQQEKRAINGKKEAKWCKKMVKKGD